MESTGSIRLAIGPGGGPCEIWNETSEAWEAKQCWNRFRHDDA